MNVNHTTQRATPIAIETAVPNKILQFFLKKKKID
jgi:hypothetical protein